MFKMEVGISFAIFINENHRVLGECFGSGDKEAFGVPRIESYNSGAGGNAVSQDDVTSPESSQVCSAGLILPRPG